MKSTISLAATLALLLAGAWLGTRSLNLEGRVFTVEIRETGFHPREISVRPGDSIIFRNLSKETARPASDPHPTHTYYPEFDAEKDVLPGGTWTFRFVRPGIWHFHDHLNGGSIGTVYVKDPAGSFSEQELSGCKGTNINEDRCFDEQVRSATKTKGIEAAFALLTARYDLGKLPAACHWTGHRIGEEAYWQEAHGRPFRFDPAMYYCGYGFLHGYLEALLREDPKEKEQKDKVIAFCERARQELGGEAWDNCVHGVGSGFTANPPDPEHWGDPQAMITEGLDTCGRYFEKRDREVCFTGVYATIANFSSVQNYGLSLDLNDFLGFCRTQPKENLRACIGEFIAKFGKAYGGDLARIKEVLKNLDAEHANLVVRVAANVLMQDDLFSEAKLAKNLAVCQSLSPATLHDACLDGITWGFIYQGKFGEEYKKGVAFCRESPLAPAERDHCFSGIVTFASRVYSPEQMKKVCEAITATGRTCPSPREID
jgi:hypothetical protein